MELTQEEADKLGEWLGKCRDWGDRARQIREWNEAHPNCHLERVGSLIKLTCVGDDAGSHRMFGPFELR